MSKCFNKNTKGVIYLSKIISIASRKGGVGKTTTAVNLISALPGKKILIEMDPQGNASVSLGTNPDLLDKTIHTLLTGRTNFEETVIKTEYCDLLPANDDLSDLDMVLILNKDNINPVTVLKNALEPIVGNYDYVIIDCPPSKGLLTINALVASTEVIIPLQCEYLAASGVNKIIEAIQKTKELYNPDLNIMGIVPTIYDNRTSLSGLVLQDARRYFMQQDIKVFDTTIYKCVRFAEAPMSGKPAINVYSEHDAVRQYINLAKEIE
jgi:chromosome partitioning protein